MILRHHDDLDLFSSNAITIQSQPINNWLVYTPNCFQAKPLKDKGGLWYLKPLLTIFQLYRGG